MVIVSTDSLIMRAVKSARSFKSWYHHCVCGVEKSVFGYTPGNGWKRFFDCVTVKPGNGALDEPKMDTCGIFY
jgi:hypothetical protein